MYAARKCVFLTIKNVAFPLRVPGCGYSSATEQLAAGLGPGVVVVIDIVEVSGSSVVVGFVSEEVDCGVVVGSGPKVAGVGVVVGCGPSVVVMWQLPAPLLLPKSMYSPPGIEDI